MKPAYLYCSWWRNEEQVSQASTSWTPPLPKETQTDTQGGGDTRRRPGKNTNRKHYGNMAIQITLNTANAWSKQPWYYAAPNDEVDLQETALRGVDLHRFELYTDNMSYFHSSWDTNYIWKYHITMTTLMLLSLLLSKSTSVPLYFCKWQISVYIKVQCRPQHVISVPAVNSSFFYLCYDSCVPQWYDSHLMTLGCCHDDYYNWVLPLFKWNTGVGYGHLKWYGPTEREEKNKLLPKQQNLKELHSPL